VLRDDQVGFADAGCVLLVHLFAVDEEDEVGVVLRSAGVAEAAR
jgi:hypothetical protein